MSAPISDAERVKIAEFVGFTNVHRFNKWKEGGPMSDGSLIGDMGGRTRCHIPNFANSLDAMHEAEARLTPHQCFIYERKLAHLFFDGTNPNDGPPAWMWHATSNQRAIAFLQVIETTERK